jgi:uncharacterized protein YegP (UPF0339 family)
MILNIQSSLLCDADECLSFIIVFLNLLTVFYLVYSSYKKFTKITEYFGYAWSGFIALASVIVLAIHTCIFTISGTVFTGMAISAILSMVFEHKKEDSNETSKTNLGCYVIFKTTDDKFVFGLHNKKKELLALSFYKYNSVEDAKEAIAYSRESAQGIELEDLTADWVIDAKHPKFKMYSEDEKYFFEFNVSESITLLKSEAIDESSKCQKMAKDAMRCVVSNVTYMSSAKKDIKNGEEFSLHS